MKFVEPTEGGHSPWGPIQSVTVVADGLIWFVSTASHGGYKINPKIKSVIPKSLRLDSLYYEEDCEWALLHLAFPNLFKDNQSQAEKTVMNWFPKAWETFRKQKLSPGQSFKKDQDTFYKENKDNYIVVAAWGDYKQGVPKDFVYVMATLGGHRNFSDTSTIKYFLIPAKEYSTRYVVDTNKYKEIPEIK